MSVSFISAQHSVIDPPAVATESCIAHKNASLGAVQNEYPPEHHFFSIHASQMAANGYFCFPLPPRQKRTHWKGWSKFCAEAPTEQQIAAWRSKHGDHGIALAAGFSVIAVDIDCLLADQADVVERLTREFLGNTPLMRIGQFPKRALIYRVAPGAVIESESVGKLDLIGDRRYLVGFGIHPDTRQPYTWENTTPATVPVSALPAVTPAKIARFLDAVRAYFSIEAVPGVQADPTPTTVFPDNEAKPLRTSADRVLDGRDTLLTRLVYHAFATHSTAGAIADAAWLSFTQQADLSRPKRSGCRPWSYQDALTKARYLLQSCKPRPGVPSMNSPGGTTSGDPAQRERFGHFVDRACAAGLLTRTDAAVSHAMLTFVPPDQPEGCCFASRETVAAMVGCKPNTVKKSRRRLRELHLWEATLVGGGRGQLARYQPQFNSLNQASAAVSQRADLSIASPAGVSS